MIKLSISFYMAIVLVCGIKTRIIFFKTTCFLKPTSKLNEAELKMKLLVPKLEWCSQKSLCSFYCDSVLLVTQKLSNVTARLETQASQSPLACYWLIIGLVAIMPKAVLLGV